MLSSKKRSVKKMELLIRQKNIALDKIKIDGARAKTLTENAQKSLTETQTSVQNIEHNIREKMQDQTGFSINGMILNQQYLQSLRTKRDHAEIRFNQANHIYTEITNQLQSENNKLKVLTKIKDSRRTEIMRDINKKMDFMLDELSAQKKGKS